jgi:16S rRNA (uracil1498-N3)-methyltransferase
MQRSALLAPPRHAGSLGIGQTFTLDDPMRAALALREVNVSEAFTLADAAGQYFRASRKTETSALVYEEFASSPESNARITLFCAILGRQRMIQVTQKAAELGCVALVPLITEHSVQRGPALEKEKPWAWRGQSVKGSRQCRRGSVMFVAEPTQLRDALASSAWREARARYFLDDRTSAAALPASRDAADYALLVGPEGGLSDAERSALMAAEATPLRLGGRVLRAETAVFAGLTVLQHQLGDMG